MNYIDDFQGTTPYSNTDPSSAKFGSYYKYLQSAYYAGYTGILESIEHFEGKMTEIIDQRYGKQFTMY